MEKALDWFVGSLLVCWLLVGFLVEFGSHLLGKIFYLIWLTLVILFVVNRNWIVHRRRMINWTVNGNRVIIWTMFVIFLQKVFVSDKIVDLTNGSLTALSFQWISQRNGHQDHQKRNKNLGARKKLPNLLTKYVTGSRSYYWNSDLPLASFCRKSSLRYEILDNIGIHRDLFNRPYIWKDFLPFTTIQEFSAAHDDSAFLINTTLSFRTFETTESHKDVSSSKGRVM